MIAPELFHFLRPQWFVALLPLALLIWFLFFRKGAQSNWETVVDERLLPHILIRGAAGTRRTAILLIAAGGLLGIVALAGPVWERLPQPVFTSEDALVIALDLTRSMDANDVSPSRLERARYKISDILDQRQEGQTALLVYTGAAFTVTPLTDDVGTIRSQLNALNTSIMPVTGNRTDKAVTLALDLLQQGGMGRGHVLLITDEATPEVAADSVTLLRGAGYRLSILGVGTRHGAPVLLPDGGFLQGQDGQIVIPTLDENDLRELAVAGGGVYVRLSKDDQDTGRLREFFSGVQPEGEQAGAEITADVWREQGPWLVLCLLPLAALLFRRGYVLGLLLLLPLSDPAQALDWESLWLRKDQQGQRAMNDQDFTGAAELFDDPAWQAAARHRAGDYQGAIDSLEPLDNVQSSYNRGNALARLGRYQEAIAAYERTLAGQPDHSDAKFNKELLEQALARQQQQQQQSKQEQESQQDQQQATQQPQQQQAGAGEEQQTEDREQQAESGGQQQEQQARQEAAEQDEAFASAQQEQQQEQEQQEPREPAREQSTEQSLAQADAQKTAEEQQATEQWLRRIPDDPSGLLRRKFRYQYQQREYEENNNEQTW